MSAWEKESYLQEVCAHIRWKRAHEAVRRELGDHIDDQRQAFVEAGLPEEEAARRAVEEMGDPAEAGARLNRHYRPRTAWNLVGLIAALMLTGLLMRGPNRGWGDLWLVTPAVFLIGSRLPLHWLTRAPMLLYPALCVAAVAAEWARLPIEWKSTVSPFEKCIWWPGGFGGPVVSLLAGLPVLFAAIVYRMRGRGYRGILACLGFAALGVGASWFASQPGFAQAIAASFPVILAVAAHRGWFQTDKKKSTYLILGIAGGHLGRVPRGNALPAGRHRHKIQSNEFILRNRLCGRRRGACPPAGAGHGKRHKLGEADE